MGRMTGKCYRVPVESDGKQTVLGSIRKEEVEAQRGKKRKASEEDVFKFFGGIVAQASASGAISSTGQAPAQVTAAPAAASDGDDAFESLTVTTTNPIFDRLPDMFKAPIFTHLNNLQTSREKAQKGNHRSERGGV